MASERVTFSGHAGSPIAGILDTPDGDPTGVALFAHCFTCSKDLRVVREVSRSLNAAGIAVLRFDFTGLGESGGEFHETSFTTNLEDIVSAARFCEENVGAVGLLVGHSLGGAAVLAVAGRIASCRCVATIGAPAEARHVRHLLADAEFGEDGTAPVSIGGRPFTIGEGFVRDLDAHSVAERIATLRRPLMIFHSPVDSIVGIENAEKIYLAARHPKSFVSLGKADHLLSDPKDARFLGSVLGAWASHQLSHG